MKIFARFVVLAVVLGLAGGGLWWWTSREPPHPADELVLYGNVDIRQVELAFNGSQRIARMIAREGDRVSKGDLLAELEASRLEYAVARARARVHAQEQAVAVLEAGTRPEEIRKARAELEEAEAVLQNARRTNSRILALSADRAVSRERADDAQAAVATSEARVKKAREALELAVAGPRKEEIAGARATLEAYEAELALARRELEDARLLAPADGIVQNRIAEPGDMASPQRPVYTLALTDPLWVRAYVSEPDLGKIKPGMAAQVTTDSYPGKLYKGWVGFVSPTAEFTPKSVETPELRTKLVYQVRVFVCNPQDELRLGMPATVAISLDSPGGQGRSGSDVCRDE